MRCQWLPGQYRRAQRGQRENDCRSTRTIGGRRCRTSALATGSSGSLQRMQRENGRTAEARSKRRRRCRTAGPEGRKGRCPRRVDRVDMVRRTRDDREVRGNRTDADEALRRQSAQWPVGSHATGAPPPHHKTVNIYLIINLTDRPVRDLAHAVAFAPIVACRSTGSVDRTASAAPFPPAQAVPDPRRRLTSCKAHLQRRRSNRLAASPTAAERGVVTQIPTCKEVE